MCRDAYECAHVHKSVSPPQIEERVCVCVSVSGMSMETHPAPPPS